MNRRRDLILAEMGLGPRWRLRKAAHAVSVSNISDADASSGTRASEVDLLPNGERSERPAVNMELASGPDGVRSGNILAMQWPELKAAVAGCTACGLCKTRTNTVFGVGDENADLR